VCTHCLDLPSQTAAQELYSIKDHLSEMHDVENPLPEIDYYRDFEAPQGHYAHMPDKISILKIKIPQH